MRKGCKVLGDSVIRSVNGGGVVAHRKIEGEGPGMDVQFTKKTSGTGTRSTESESKPERKGLGLVWITCSYPVVTRGLEEILEEGARVHVGHEPPAGETPSSIIFCTKEAGDVASEVKRLREIAPYTAILILICTSMCRSVRPPSRREYTALSTQRCNPLRSSTLSRLPLVVRL